MGQILKGVYGKNKIKVFLALIRQHDMFGFMNARFAILRQMNQSTKQFGRQLQTTSYSNTSRNLHSCYQKKIITKTIYLQGSFSRSIQCGNVETGWKHAEFVEFRLR